MNTTKHRGEEARGKAGYFSRRLWFLVMWPLFAAAYTLTSPGPLSPRSVDTFENLFGEEGPFDVDTSSFAWMWPDLLDKRGSGYWHRAVFLARPQTGSLRELFVADFKVSSDHRIRDFTRVRNLSKTSDADEDVLAVDHAGRVAFAGASDGYYRTVVLMNLAGEKKELTRSWNKWQRMADRITNFQKWGRQEGIDCRHYIFASPPKRLGLEYNGRILTVKTEKASFEIDQKGETDSSYVVAQKMVKAPQAMLSFAVDTARAVPWIGAEKIAWLEKHWFNFNDWFARVMYAAMGEDSPPPVFKTATLNEVSSERGLPDWPPPTIESIVTPTLEGEGQWFQMDDELFTDPRAGPALFYYAFVRADPERPFARVFMTAWDPARVELHIMAGTVEPAPSTGLAGIGEVPREDPEGDVSRLVGAFNGAFQALHGQWGMALGKMPLLPPKPYAATVAVLEDGRVGFGAWPYPVGEIPGEIKDFRQNLLPLVQGGIVNPFNHKYWGAAPWKTPDRVYTIRTGLCLTRDGKLVYFYGDHLSAQTLGKVMTAARCDFGIHLDMNPGHSGFEFYRVDKAGSEPKRKRELKKDEEAEGPVPRRSDLFFRAKKLAEDMRHQRFPRYINRDPRDFFYLLRRESIFDDPPGSTDGWKPIRPKLALPTSAVSADLGGEARIYKVDLDQVEVKLLTEEPEDALVAIPFSIYKEGISTGLIINGQAQESLKPGEPALIIDSGRPVLAGSQEGQNKEMLVQGVPATIAHRVGVGAGIVFDSNGHMFAATGPEGSTAALFEALGTASGGEPLGLLPAGTDGSAVYWLAVRHRPRAAWKRIFPEVVPVPRDVWRRAYWKPKEDLTLEPPSD